MPLNRRSLVRSLLTLPLLASTRLARAAEFTIDKVIEAPEAFLAEAFGSSVPPPQVLELAPAMQAQVAAVFGRNYPQSRLRYWRAAGHTAWIFDDIGKEGYVPTTAGFVVRSGAIEIARVLIYRESRGEQVGLPSFLAQFVGARAAGPGLDKSIDNIAGATLSVKMMQRMARTALVLDTLAP